MVREMYLFSIQNRKSVMYVTHFSAFKDQPESPPSRAQAVLREGQSASSDNVDYVASIKRLMTNRGYVLLLITYGLNVGVFYAISTLLNSVILMHFEVYFPLIRRR